MLEAQSSAVNSKESSGEIGVKKIQKSEQSMKLDENENGNWNENNARPKAVSLIGIIKCHKRKEHCDCPSQVMRKM